MKIKFLIRILAGWFISGLVTILPLAITMGLLGWIYGTLNNWFGKQSTIGGALSSLADAMSFSASLTLLIAYVFIVALVIATGAIVSRTARNRIGEFIKRMLENFPVVGSIYNSAEQVVGIFGKKHGEDPARTSKIILFRLANTLLVGMLPSSTPIYIDGVPHLMVYYPATPVPMSGQNFLVPASEVYKTDLKFEDMTKILVSLGSIAPEVLGEKLSLSPVIAAPEPAT